MLISSSDVCLGLTTRKHYAIKNFYCSEPPTDGDLLAVEDLKKQFPDSIPRPSGPSRGYNCHGLTFGARRTGIVQSADVAKILSDDGYRKLDGRERIWPGDVAIYRNEIEITHSGIVMYVKSDVPWILSKWGGRYHEAIHKPLDCPYSDGNVSYYRLDK